MSAPLIRPDPAWLQKISILSAKGMDVAARAEHGDVYVYAQCVLLRLNLIAIGVTSLTVVTIILLLVHLVS